MLPCVLQEGQEVKCFEAIAAWVQADTEARARHFLELFGMATGPWMTVYDKKARHGAVVSWPPTCTAFHCESCAGWRGSVSHVDIRRLVMQATSTWTE